MMSCSKNSLWSKGLKNIFMHFSLGLDNIGFKHVFSCIKNPGLEGDVKNQGESPRISTSSEAPVGGRQVHSLLQLSERRPCHIWTVDRMKFASLDANLVGPIPFFFSLSLSLGGVPK